MNVSLVILTFNRADTVSHAVSHNVAHAGYPISQLVHVDNGSRDNVREVMRELAPDVMIYHKENLGVSKGYNAGYAHARGDLVCITGCDRLMPEGWLARMIEHFEAIPTTGIISCYSHGLERVPERTRGGQINVNGKEIIPCMPFEARILRRELFLEIGYLDEGFGLYGGEDCSWGERSEKILAEKGLLSYTLPHFQAQHLGTEGVNQWDGKDNADYHAFKHREATDPSKEQRKSWNRANGYPKHNPFV